MTISLTPSQLDTTKALKGFLAGILPAGIDIQLSQANRVAEPSGADFVMMTPIRRNRVETNFDQFVDAKFTGAIAGNTLTISHVFYGSLKVGSVLFGVDVLTTPPTQITALGTGTGGIGTYTVNNAQTVTSQVIAAGVLDARQATEVTIQLDVHGPASADNAQRITTMLRDDYAVQVFNASNPNVTPLYADEARQVPFTNDQNQVENRWIVDACLQVNATVNDIPQQFFDQIVTTLIPADIFEPA